MPPNAAFAGAPPPLATPRTWTQQLRGVAATISRPVTAATAPPIAEGRRAGQLCVPAAARGGWEGKPRAGSRWRPARVRDAGGHPSGAAAASVGGVSVAGVAAEGVGGGGGGGGGRGGAGDGDVDGGGSGSGGSGGSAGGGGGDADGAFLSTLSPRRVAALTVVAMVFTAPAFHYLYTALEAVVPVSAAAPRNVWIQLGVDQLVAAPIYLAIFFPAFGLLSGRRVADVVAQTRRDYLPSLRVTYAVFPVFQWVSFTFLPPPLRVLAVNVVDLGFNTVLSYMANRPGEEGARVA
ncbi:hypothetical protein MMPV_007908 [Pyropia vietnamensis]